MNIFCWVSVCNRIPTAANLRHCMGNIVATTNTGQPFILIYILAIHSFYKVRLTFFTIPFFQYLSLSHRALITFGDICWPRRGRSAEAIDTFRIGSEMYYSQPLLQVLRYCSLSSYQLTSTSLPCCFLMGFLLASCMKTFVLQHAVPFSLKF